ncbi:hypothetical protein RhiirB3_451441 [Rhizophagus irregularis]|nr:hypothetical protein RhiirB3_451441 [Rhizophagus irregularis]
MSEYYLSELLRYNYAFRTEILYKHLELKKCLDENEMPRDNINRYLEKSNRYNIAHQRIRRIKERITSTKSKEILFYIDGSVRDQGTENIASIFGIMIYDDDNRLIDKYFSTLEQWITAIKAETMAFFTTLLMIPPGKKCTIYTDCQNIINNYNLLTSNIIVTTTRDILKFSNNNAIWFNIKELLEDQMLDIQLVKVDAHSHDILHNQVDKEIKDRYGLEYNLANTLVKYNAEQYRFPLVWNGHLVEMNIHWFIRLITRVEGLEKFLNLNRNKRYRSLDVEWNIVFLYLNKQEKEEKTFSSSKYIEKQKWMKVQRLIEEIPTIEQLKKSSYDIYRDFRCVVCNKKKEDFIHVWTCRYNRKKMKFIIEKYVERLRLFLLEKGIKDVTTKELFDLGVFGNRFTNDKLNFVDLIKGIFPSQLYKFILGKLGNNQKK